MRKKVAIFGSTGSIGQSTLQVIRDNPDLFEVVTLVAGKNVSLLYDQVCDFHPKHVYIQSKKNAYDLYSSLCHVPCNYMPLEEIYYGDDGLEQISSIYDFDIAVSALVGIAGLKPTYNLIKSGKQVALANKEALVTGGKLILEHANKYNCKLVPIDSEHSAIMQCLQGEHQNPIEKILLTASGGPFFTRDLTPDITVNDVLKHPTWKMGHKITVDSATMMNKGFEVIEAALLFDVSPSQIQVVIHRQSIVHSAVQFKDGTIMASLGPTDMQVPIAYAMNFPNRLQNSIERVDLFKLLALTFEKPDLNKFPCLQYAYSAIEGGLDKQIILNAANEVAVANFLSNKIRFISIPEIIYTVMNSCAEKIQIDSIDTILALDADTRKKAENIVSKM